jgi:glycerol-3-phosphate dehydrogenase (NAD(P)+)
MTKTMSKASPSISIIGAGAWGTALAQALAQAGRSVTLWARESDVVEQINTRHENAVFLSNVPLHPSIQATNDLSTATQSANLILLVTPAQHIRTTLRSMKPDLKPNTPVILGAKGIEIATGKTLSDAALEEIPDLTIGVLSGPTFASEIARGLPCAVTIALNKPERSDYVRDTIACRTVRPYMSDDLIGVQLGGAIKNVIAIACGIVAGKGLGESARAATLTRGLAEMARLSIALGGKRETLMGLSGIGDLVLTASSMQSRNYSLGFALGQGRSVAEILGERKAVTEGVHTAKALTLMATQHKIEMPVSIAVHRCVNEGLSIDNAIAELLDRPLKHEAV